jgi:hypothetical protein
MFYSYFAFESLSTYSPFSPLDDFTENEIIEPADKKARELAIEKAKRLESS